MRLRSRLPQVMVFCLASVSLFVSISRADEIKGRISWPDEWTVFAPFERANPVPDDEFFRTIPDSITTEETTVAPARTAEARTLEVEPGRRIDLVESGIFEEYAVGNVAYIFLELDSPQQQVVTLGMGGDWWLQAWMNGEEFFDTLEDGNDGYPPTMLDQTVNVSLREGRNVLAVRFITGRASAGLALGGPDEFAAAEKRRQERRAARELNVMPDQLEDRLAFPVEEQAAATARQGMELPATDADLSLGDLAGLESMPERQMRSNPLTFRPRHDLRAELIDTLQPRYDDPVTIR